MSKSGNDHSKTHWQRFHLDPLGMMGLAGSYFYEIPGHNII